MAGGVFLIGKGGSVIVSAEAKWIRSEFQAVGWTTDALRCKYCRDRHYTDMKLHGQFQTKLTGRKQISDEMDPVNMRAIFIRTETSEFRNPHYHKPTDTPVTLDYAFPGKVAGRLLAAG